MSHGLAIPKRHGTLRYTSRPWGMSGGLWLPSAITGIRYWWRPDSGITLEVGDVVSHWLDKIAGKDAAQADNAKRPAWKTGADGINGQPVVQGDGSDDFLQTAAFASALAQPFTVWCVATIATDNDATRMMVTGIVINRALFNHRYIVDANEKSYQINYGTYINGAINTLDVAGTPVFHLSITEHETNVDKMWANGVLKVSGNAGTGTLTGITMCASWSGASFQSDCKIAELGIVKTATGFISATDLANLEAYVKGRYNLSW